MFSEFKQFLLRGNVIDLAVAVIIGAAFGKIVDSLVSDVITPMLGLIGGQPDFSAIMIGPIMLGNFLNALVAFLIMAAALFFIVVKPMNMAMKAVKTSDAPSTKQCPECASEIPMAARRCPHCTSEVGMLAAAPAD
jgi:large conductance mechanosensitive channel